jgi:hypothetical protein
MVLISLYFPAGDLPNNVSRAEAEELKSIEESALTELKDLVFSRVNFLDAVYISPCFYASLETAELLESWGITIAGFLDNNLYSEYSLECQKAGHAVYNISKMEPGGGLVLLFDMHSNAIASQFVSRGLVENKDFLITGI